MVPHSGFFYAEDKLRLETFYLLKIILEFLYVYLDVSLLSFEIKFKFNLADELGPAIVQSVVSIYIKCFYCGTRTN